MLIFPVFAPSLRHLMFFDFFTVVLRGGLPSLIYQAAPKSFFLFFFLATGHGSLCRISRNSHASVHGRKADFGCYGGRIGGDTLQESRRGRLCLDGLRFCLAASAFEGYSRGVWGGRMSRLLFGCWLRMGVCASVCKGRKEGGWSIVIERENKDMSAFSISVLNSC